VSKKQRKPRERAKAKGKPRKKAREEKCKLTIIE